MNIQLISPKPNDVIVLKVSEKDSISDAEATYHNLLDTFPLNKVVVVFTEQDIQVNSGGLYDNR